MENNPGAVDGIIYLALFLGFFGHAAYENSTKAGPLAQEPINSNAGSIMMYLVWLAAIAVGTTLAVGVLIWLMIHFGGATDALYMWTVGAIFALCGALFNRAAIYRARDAGRSRGFALLAIIPFANLWLMFASPKVASERPPYVPAATALRFVIGFAAFAAIAGTRALDTVGTDPFINSQVARKVVENVAVSNADLPKQLDEITILQAAEANTATKEIVYRYTLTSDDLDPERLQNWLDTKMKPNTLKELCEDPAITDFGWNVVYRYWDKGTRLVGEARVSSRDCATK